jgi:hypothetical protein
VPPMNSFQAFNAVAMHILLGPWATPGGVGARHQVCRNSRFQGHPGSTAR